jgi:adenylate cyclase, class 2
MSYEVELKYRLADHDQLVVRLFERGAQRGAAISQQDVYFNHPARDFAQTNEALRIRRVIGEGYSRPRTVASGDCGDARSAHDQNIITYKGPRRSGPTKTREEIEIGAMPGADTFDQIASLLAKLGFRRIAVVRKSRTTFRVNEQGHQIEVALDTVDGVGQFAEVETQAATVADLPAAQSAVLGLAKTLGLTQVEPRSYLRMVFEAGSPFAAVPANGGAGVGS